LTICEKTKYDFSSSFQPKDYWKKETIRATVRIVDSEGKGFPTSDEAAAYNRSKRCEEEAEKA